MKTARVLLPLLLILVAAAYWATHRRPRVRQEAYVSERSVTLWTSTAQVRQSLATLRYGEKVTLLKRQNEQAEVRTQQGVTGWLDGRLLMAPALWQRSVQLLAAARAMPVQARGRTKVLTNVRVEPGRNASRVYQFVRGVPVEVLSRAVAEWSPVGEEGAAVPKEGPEEQRPRMEDWLLVRGLASGVAAPGAGSAPRRIDQAGVADLSEEQVEIAGWVLGRFIELEPPGPVRDYASSSGMRVIAWLELNRVRDANGEVPQYLAVGVKGAEGQPCDFTMLRVYTWDAKRNRYETAYVESGLCGKLPIRVGKSASGAPEFRFAAVGASGEGERLYRMRQTLIRRVREEQRPARPR